MARMKHLARGDDKRRKYGGKHYALVALGMTSVTLVALSGMFPGRQDVRHLFSPQSSQPLQQPLDVNNGQPNPHGAFEKYRIAAMPSPATAITKIKRNNTSLTSTRASTTPTSKKRSRDHYNNDGRPIFYLHIGIPKTATTFLQCSICKDYYSKGENDTQGRHERFFLQDNLVYIGTCPCEAHNIDFVLHKHDAIFDHKITWDEQHELGPMPFSKSWTVAAAGDERSNNQTGTIIRPQLNETFRTRIQQVHARGHDAIIIFEGFHKFDQPHVEALAAFLNPLFRVHVILAYRRLFEWLPSKYNSISKPMGHGPIDDAWPGTKVSVMQNGRLQTKMALPTMPFALDRNDSFGQLVRDLETLQQHPAHIVRDNYARYFSQVEIIPLHDVPEPREWKHHKFDPAETDAVLPTINPYLHHLFCSVLSAPHVCLAIQQGQMRGSAESNPSVSLDYFRLAEAAHQHGWVPSNMSRTKVAQLVQDKMNTDNEAQIAALSTSDTIQKQQHLQCLPNATLNRIVNLSLATEAKMFGSQQAIQWRRGHELAFEEYRHKNKYCWLDTATLLSIPSSDDKNTSHSDWMGFFKRLGQ